MLLFAPSYILQHSYEVLHRVQHTLVMHHPSNLNENRLSSFRQTLLKHCLLHLHRRIKHTAVLRDYDHASPEV